MPALVAGIHVFLAAVVEQTRGWPGLRPAMIPRCSAVTGIQYPCYVGGVYPRFFRDTAANALEQLGETRPQAETVLAVFNTLTSEPAIRNLERINETCARELLILILEPAIARIVVVDELRETRTYFISRATPAQPSRQAASYRSPIGRLAALPVGSDYDLVTPNGFRTLEVVERATLRAKIIEQQWDSVYSTVEAKEFRPLTIKSFRRLLRWPSPNTALTSLRRFSRKTVMPST